MDMTTLIIVAIVLLAMLYLMRNRATPAGYGPTTRRYDDADIRSGGSIGGPSTYDTGYTRTDDAMQSRAYDTPEVRSGGGIGTASGPAISPDYSAETSTYRRTPVDQPAMTSDDDDEERRYNSPNVRSGGGIGGG